MDSSSDHVLIMYLNDLFMKQSEFLIEKYTATTSSFSSNISFSYNLMAQILFFFLIGYVHKLTNILVTNLSSASTPAVSGVQEVLEQIETKPDSLNKSMELAANNNDSVHSKEMDVAISRDSVLDSPDFGNEQ